MRRLVGAISVLLVLAAAIAFQILNQGRWTDLDLGFMTLYRIPVVWIAFGGLLLGMLVMLLAGIRSDLKVRRILRERLRAEDREERAPVDRYQQDLFQEESDRASNREE